MTIDARRFEEPPSRVFGVRALAGDLENLAGRPRGPYALELLVELGGFALERFANAPDDDPAEAITDPSPDLLARAFGFTLAARTAIRRHHNRRVEPPGGAAMPAMNATSIGIAQHKMDVRRANNLVVLMRAENPTLGLAYENGGRRSRPSNGEKVSDTVVRMIIGRSEIIGANQSYRHVVHQEEPHE